MFDIRSTYPKVFYTDTDNISDLPEQVKRYLKLQLSSTYGMCAPKSTPYIKGIYPNEEKKLVIVKWSDDSVTKVECSKDDTFDIYVSVALACVRKFFGSNNQFRKIVDKLTKGAKK
jgi:hypothetical protein